MGKRVELMFTSPNSASFTIDRLVQRFKLNEKNLEAGKARSHIGCLSALVCNDNAIGCWLVCDIVYPMGLVITKGVKVEDPHRRVLHHQLDVTDQCREHWRLYPKKNILPPAARTLTPGVAWHGGPHCQLSTAGGVQ